MAPVYSICNPSQSLQININSLRYYFLAHFSIVFHYFFTIASFVNSNNLRRKCLREKYKFV